MSGDHDHEHDHEHDHPHEHGERDFQPDLEDTVPFSEYAYLETAVRELLIEKGIVTADQIRAAIETIDARGPHLGAQVVARAWTDPDFKARLLRDGSDAVEELDIKVKPMKLLVVENTEDVHNVVVCTLCSCYPRFLLGKPPLWYKSRAYRSRVVREPRDVLAEFGTTVPDGMEVRVHDSTADMRYLVLPERPAGTGHLDEAGLAELVTRDSMIGVAVPKSPEAMAAE